MAEYRMDPKKQFSKRLARWTAVFWFVYMTWLSCIFIIQPAAAQYTFYMAALVTVVMMTNVIAYTANSIQEKILFAMLDRTKLEISLGKSGKGSEKNAETVTEEGGNG